MAVDLQQLAKVLEASLDPSQNKQGEHLLPEFSRCMKKLIVSQLNLLFFRKKRKRTFRSHCYRLFLQKLMVAQRDLQARSISKIISSGIGR